MKELGYWVLEVLSQSWNLVLILSDFIIYGYKILLIMVMVCIQSYLQKLIFCFYVLCFHPLLGL